MLATSHVFAVATCALALVGCNQSTDATLVGEWDNPNHDHNSCVTYRADHTYFFQIENPEDENFGGSGTWDVDGDQMICRDYEHGESKAQILKVSQNELQVRGRDRIISTYERVK